MGGGDGGEIAGRAQSAIPALPRKGPWTITDEKRLRGANFPERRFGGAAAFSALRTSRINKGKGVYRDQSANVSSHSHHARSREKTA